MITFPLGWTSGWPPSTERFGVVLAIHVNPPSLEDEIFSRFEWAESSNCA
jgi:hypothetical protein